MSYIGNEPIAFATRTVTEVSATAGQTVFTANGGYTVGFIDVFVNGSKLTNSDFTATNGTTITLNEAAQASDIVRLEALGTFLTGNHVPLVGDSNITGNVNVSGNVGIGTSSPGSRFEVVDGEIQTSSSLTNNTGQASFNVWSNRSDSGKPRGQLLVSGSSYASSYQGIRANTMTLYSAWADIAINADTGNNIQFWTGGNERMRIDGSGNLQFNSGYGSVATAYGCRAWVNFNGTGTVAIRASGNVSSITDNGTGDYTVNFTNAMTDANYAPVVNAKGVASVAGFGGVSVNITAATTSYRFSIQGQNGASTLSYDSDFINVAVFR